MMREFLYYFFKFIDLFIVRVYIYELKELVDKMYVVIRFDELE